MSDTALIILLAAFVVAALLLAAAETSLIRISHLRAASLARQGSRRAKLLVSLLDHLPRVLNATLFAALLVQIGAAAVTGILADRHLGGGIAITVASVALTLVLFVYTEAIPKTFAVRHPERVAMWMAFPVRALELVFRPVVYLLVWLADLQSPGKGITTSPTVTEYELRTLAAQAAHEGEITSHDLELIEKTFRFGDRVTSEIMVPRPDIVAVEVNTPVEDAIPIALRSGHRRIPIFESSIDQIIGVVSLRQLVSAAQAEGHRPTLDQLMRPPLVVPESKRIVDLLRTMQAEGTHLAVVVDEHGGTAGLATIEDVVEQLLGSVADEGSRASSRHRTRPGGGIVVEGKTSVRELSERLGAQLPKGEWTTVAGLVIGLIGKVPRPGEEATAAGFRFRVVSATGRRVRKVEVMPDQSLPALPPADA